jgi:hypothetical protein
VQTEQSQHLSACRRHTLRQPRDDKPVKREHADGELQARRLPIAGSPDVLEEIAKCLAGELEWAASLSRSWTGFRLQKITLGARPPRLRRALSRTWCNMAGCAQPCDSCAVIDQPLAPDEGAIANWRLSLPVEAGDYASAPVMTRGTVAFGRRRRVRSLHQTERKLYGTRARTWLAKQPAKLLGFSSR